MVDSVGDQTPDEILMAAYQAGNEAAFGQLFDRYAGSVYGFLVRRLGDRTLAEDLYQEVFLRLHRARQTYDPARPFRAWLFGIVHNLLTDALRSRGRLPETTSLDQPTVPGERPHDVAADEDSPEARVAARQETRVLECALATLPSDEATVLILAWIEGFSYDEIGSVVGRSAGATKQLAYRALKRLRARMAPDGKQEAP